MKNLTLEQIFNRAEVINYSKNYGYSEVSSISGKSYLTSGAESLKKIPLKVKLHHSFCNPQKVIDEIEKMAKNKNIFNYFQNGKYIGEYVISDSKTALHKTSGEMIIYAELDVTLLEAVLPEEIEPSYNISFPLYDITSQVIQNFKIKAAKTEKDNAFKIQSTVTNNLSSTANQTLNTLQNSIINEIKQHGISKSFEIVEKYTNDLRSKNVLSSEEVNEIKTELEKIPGKILDNLLRI
ncbi:phage tail protein [bacterium]|nr:phage tail protein [bacterium]